MLDTAARGHESNAGEHGCRALSLKLEDGFFLLTQSRQSKTHPPLASFRASSRLGRHTTEPAGFPPEQPPNRAADYTVVAVMRQEACERCFQ